MKFLGGGGETCRYRYTTYTYLTYNIVKHIKDGQTKNFLALFPVMADLEDIPGAGGAPPPLELREGGKMDPAPFTRRPCHLLFNNISPKIQQVPANCHVPSPCTAQLLTTVNSKKKKKTSSYKYYLSNIWKTIWNYRPDTGHNFCLFFVLVVRGGVK